MKLMRLIFIGFALSCFTTAAFAQSENNIQNTTTYKAEVFGSAASGSNTPFWMVSNRYGVVPLDANNGYLNAAVFHNQKFGKGFYWEAGLDLIGAMPRNRNIFIQQAFAEIGYKSMLLKIGSKEDYNSLWDRNLSSGDLVQSANARPIPEIKISMPQFTIIPGTKGWIQVKGDFAVGRSFDTDYLKDFTGMYTGKEQIYIKNVLWHHKSIFIQIKDTRNNFPLSATIGVQHFAQWGGTSTDPKIGVQPHSLKDFIRVVCGSKGGDDATISDQVNVLGSHYGSYDFKLSFTKKDWALHAYHQHYFNDKSGMIFNNGTDGLYGIQIDLPKLPWLRKIVTEYVLTRDQTGPMHFIDFDHNKYSGVGGGNDDYYNNLEYLTGLSYFNRGIGSPLIVSPEYNDGKLGFTNNRIKDWHIGAEGDISTQISYRVLFTVMNGWGTSYQPFRNKKDGTSCLVDISYTHPHLTGWTFTGSVAADTGTMVGKGIGFSFSVAKRGILKVWK
ncbi:capsule assembly Wzi family protein [Parabacteroides bouchesdurhonensis]|uniref:capsule assembly Wzi family protein n=1 Tax=Parabacteroides bouchesdurhonensis TaxID=1936995 RepID=UPI000E54C759|nr:capsule assembly Wzi family protein [Parabacteroides bouchesdurhonensis]RHJ90352.1 hypothetical protein DW095_13405 [Bacteroides sp. AM07-16]